MAEPSSSNSAHHRLLAFYTFEEKGGHTLVQVKDESDFPWRLTRDRNSGSCRLEKGFSARVTSPVTWKRVAVFTNEDLALELILKRHNRDAKSIPDLGWPSL